MKNKVLQVSKLVIAAIFLVGSLISGANDAVEDWYVRIIAASPDENLIDRGTILGELSDSSDQYDSHDLPQLEPFGTPYLTVTFDKQNWGVNSGSYKSDFRKTADRDPAKPKEWRFTVKSDDGNRDITLRWESDARLDQMILVDLKTGEEIYPVIAGKVRDHSFNMAGNEERSFIWKY